MLNKFIVNGITPHYHESFYNIFLFILQICKYGVRAQKQEINALTTQNENRDDMPKYKYIFFCLFYRKYIFGDFIVRKKKIVIFISSILLHKH